MSITDFQPAIWTTSSNSALKVSLVSDNAIQFSPTFTYPIYGESEQIFGFQDLLIHLAFDSVTFRPFVNVKYGAKLDEEADDVEGKLLSFLPKDDVVIKNESEWVDGFKNEQEKYELLSSEHEIGSYTYDGDDFVVLKSSIADPFTKKLHRRVQIFSLLFIEAASYIDEDDPNWEIFWLFNNRTKQCIGYVSTYKLWKYRGSNDFDKSSNLKYRARISQFIIFPPYQGKGHGSKLYNAIFSHWLRDATVTEITVEDPNESFDDLRDRNDLERLHKLKFFSQVPQEGVISSAWIEDKRAEFKLEKRQFNRLIEMILAYSNAVNCRIQIKGRLFTKNYDALSDMPDEERKDALQKSYLLLADDYKRILSLCRFNKRATNPSNEENSNKKIKY